MKKIQSDQTAAERYRLQMSDGTYYQPCTFLTDVNVGCTCDRKVQTSCLNLFPLLSLFVLSTCSSALSYSSLHTHTHTMSYAGMLATQMNDKVHSKELDKFCVVEVERYICNTIHERK